MCGQECSPRYFRIFGTEEASGAVAAESLCTSRALLACATTGEKVHFEETRVVAEPVGPDALEVYDAETLFARGLDLMRGGAVSEAALYFERVLKECPTLVLLSHSQVFWAEIGQLADPSQRGGYPKGPIQAEVHHERGA